MKKDIKESVLKAKNLNDIDVIETEVIKSYRNEFYNELLKDKEVKQHLAKIFNVDEEMLQNVLMINGNFPIDDFNEEEI